MDEHILKNTLLSLLRPGKGILAADESDRTTAKRFQAVGIENSSEMRRRYRQLLFTTPGAGEYLSGVILYDETLRQSSDNNIRFADLLANTGIIPGIKTDQGLVDLPGAREQVSQGLDGLAERNQEYFSLGARFAKWRSVIKIGPNLPSSQAIAANAEVLARYAKTSQDNNLVPIVEPEVLLEGNHTIEQAQAVLKQTLSAVFTEAKKEGANLAYTILKTSMALPGAGSTQSVSSEEIARRTVEVLRASVPVEIPAVVFLSGGQTPAAATLNLNAIAKLAPHPWLVTFSYSRALQDPVLKYWAGKAENVAQAQSLFATRLRLAALAQQGRYSTDMEEGSAREVASDAQN